MILAGADRSIGFDFRIDQNLGEDWTDYSISLAAATGWFGPATGLAATNTEITAVLAARDSIEIHGEYRVGAHTAGLDNFAQLGAGQVLADVSQGTVGSHAGTDRGRCLQSAGNAGDLS